MQDLGLKMQNYARSTLKTAKLFKIYDLKRKTIQDLGLKRKIMQDLRLKTQNYPRSSHKKNQNYAKSTLKNAKLCYI